MSDDQSRTDVDPAARDLLAAVRALVGQMTTDALRMQTCETEAETSRYAQAAIDEMLTRHFPALVAAHDALAAALNTASPNTPPVLSLATELPA